jgi:hypothetical protein
MWNSTTTAPRIRSSWIEVDARQRLGVLGPHAEIYNVYSVGDSGEGCEVIEFVTRTRKGAVPWTARVELCDERVITSCTVGW